VRVRVGGQLPSVDVELLGDLADAFRYEWSQLRFGRDGDVVDPTDAVPSDRLRLVDGRHGATHARYVATIRTPLSELPPDRAAEHQREVATAISTGRTDPEIIAQITKRYNDRRVVSGERVDQVDLVATEASFGSIGFAAADITHGSWVAEAWADHSAALRVVVSVRATMADLVSAYGNRPNGWVKWMTRGPFAFDGELDLGALEHRRGGRTMTITGQAGRYPYAVRVDAKATDRATDVDVTVSLRGRGTGRLVLLVAWPFIRGEIRRLLEDELADTAPLTQAISSLQTDVAKAGGPTPYAHDAVWATSPTGDKP
jgi:hypothetical protein